MVKPNLSNALQETIGNRPTAPTGPASRVGTVPVTFHLPRGVRDQLKILAAEQRTTMAALAGEGLNAVFAHYGRQGDRPNLATRSREDRRRATSRAGESWVKTCTRLRCTGAAPM